MIRSLVFGGAFNPPTAAHIGTAGFARDYLNYECVVFVPSKQAYIRYDQGKEFVFSDSARLRMLQRIAEDHSWMQVSDHEILQQEQPRTYETLCWLRTQGLSPKLLIGSDKLKELETGWRYVPEICREFGIAVMTRNQDPVREIIQSDHFLAGISQYLEWIPTPDTWQKVSSTAVRRAMAAGDLDSVADMIPPEIRNLGEFAESEENGR